MQALSAPREIKVRLGGTTYTAVLTPDLVAGGYSIGVAELPGVFTEADTVPEARKMVKEAISLWLAVPAEKKARKAR